jgi:hypothetical protein
VRWPLAEVQAVQHGGFGLLEVRQREHVLGRLLATGFRSGHRRRPPHPSPFRSIEDSRLRRYSGPSGGCVWRRGTEPIRRLKAMGLHVVKRRWRRPRRIRIAKAYRDSAFLNVSMM